MGLFQKNFLGNKYLGITEYLPKKQKKNLQC